VQTYLQIFLIGLLGGMHCIGMCGGFVAMYSLKKPEERASFPYHALYNAGRITTYSLLGGAVGVLGSFLDQAAQLRGIQSSVLLFAGIVMVLMGLNIAGLFGRGVLIDQSDITKSSVFRSALRTVINMNSVWALFLLGLLLGLLPCGLLYPVLIMAGASGGFLPGVLTMVVFGIGTVPVMMGFGFLVTRIRPHFRRSIYRVAALLIIILGFQSLLRGMALNGWIAPGRFW